MNNTQANKPAAWRFKWKGAGGYSVTNDERFVANLPHDGLEVLPEPLYPREQLPSSKVAAQHDHATQEVP